MKVTTSLCRCEEGERVGKRRNKYEVRVHERESLSGSRVKNMLCAANHELNLTRQSLCLGPVQPPAQKRWQHSRGLGPKHLP